MLPTKEVSVSPKTITLAGETEAIESPFDGYVKIKIPTYIERMELIEKISAEQEGDTKLSSTKRLIEKVIERVTEVKLTHKVSGQTIESIEDLGIYSEGSSLINELGKVLTQGAVLGKN